MQTKRQIRKTAAPATSSRRSSLVRRAQRAGAVFSIEMMMVITVLVPLMFALTEFSLLWSARHTLEAAAFEAARAAALPASNNATRRIAAKEAADEVFASARYLDEASGYSFVEEAFDVGRQTGDMVHVQLKLPMTTASPDLLAVIGISIKDKFLTAEAVTARQ